MDDFGRADDFGRTGFFGRMHEMLAFFGGRRFAPFSPGTGDRAFRTGFTIGSGVVSGPEFAFVAGFSLNFFYRRNKSVALPHKLFRLAALGAILVDNLSGWFAGCVADFFHGISK